MPGPGTIIAGFSTNNCKESANNQFMRHCCEDDKYDDADDDTVSDDVDCNGDDDYDEPAVFKHMLCF